MMKRLAALAAAVTTVALSGAQPAGAVPVTGSTNVCENMTFVAAGNTQIGGVDRYDTAVRTSRSTFKPGVDMVVLATGQAFPDALAGAAVAGNACGPLLLTPAHSLTSAVTAELKRLAPASVYISGGPGAVSSNVEQQVRAALPATTVVRATGASRYETAARMSAQYYSQTPVNTVFIASGRTYADAVAASSPAGLTAGPLLLADSGLTAVTAAELKRLNAMGSLENVIVLGGPTVVSDTTMNQIAAIVGTAADGSQKTIRIAGANRFSTTAKLVETAWGPDPVNLPSATSAFYVNGLNWPDALTAGPVAAANDAPVLLTTKACMPAATKQWDLGATSTLTSRTWVGGTGSVRMTTAAC